MGTPLGQQATVVPSVKLRAIGDYVDVAIVNSEAVPWTEFSGPRKGQPKLGQDGKPRTQDRVTGVVVRGNGVISKDDADVVPEADSVVSLYFAGHRRWDYIQAQKALDGGLQCGDIMRVKYARDEPGSGAEPKKVWEVQIRHPKPDERALAERCESELAGAAPAHTPIGDEPGYGDEEPF